MKKKILLLAVTLLFLFEKIFAQCPTTSFFANNYATTCPPLFDTLFNSSTNVLAGATYDYDFGDGTHSNLQNPNHVYGYGGIFYATLIVTNPGGCADTFLNSTPFEVGGPDIQSVTVTPSFGNIPLLVNFQLVSNAVSFVWDFDDGSPLQNDSSAVSHLYSTNGTYYPSVIITDSFFSCAYSFNMDTVTVCLCFPMYHHFPDSAAKWSEYGGWANDLGNGVWNQVAGVWYYSVAHDTILNSLTYHLIGFQDTWYYWITNGVVQVAYNVPMQPPGNIIGAYREDGSKKIWFQFLDSLSWQFDCSEIAHILNTDILIYDFNLNVGDTLSWKPHYPICHSIDSVQINNGVYRRSYNFWDGQNMGEQWIEGIGSTLGLLGSYALPPFESGCQLSCFTQNNIVLFPSGAGFCDSTLYQVGINEINVENSFLIYPNPTKNSINISSSNLQGNYSLKIYNLLGQQVKQEQHNFSALENYTVNIEELSSGYYQLVLSNNKDSFSKGFVKE